MHPDHARIDAQPRRRERRDAVHHVEGIQREVLLVPAHPARPAAVDAFGYAGARVEFLLRQHRVALHAVPDDEEGREGVRELENAGGADEGG